MKQRLAGKVIKHTERYHDDVLQRAYEKSVRGLRKFYKRQYKACKTWMKKWYIHKACEPFFMLCDDVMGDTSEIVDALCGVREFVDDLIKAIKEG